MKLYAGIDLAFKQLLPGNHRRQIGKSCRKTTEKFSSVYYRLPGTLQKESWQGVRRRIHLGTWYWLVDGLQESWLHGSPWPILRR